MLTSLFSINMLSDFLAFLPAVRYHLTVSILKKIHFDIEISYITSAEIKSFPYAIADAVEGGK